MDDRARREQNRLSWNAVAPAHQSHRPTVAAFLRAGGLTLFPEERALLGELRDQRLLHLLCNAGHDSLSLAALGAEVTGVDISDAAIAAAQALAAEVGSAARFERADVYDYLAAAQARGERFTRIYCGYGVLCWLPNLLAFATNLAALLAPGGRFVLMEFHPVSNMLDRHWSLAHDYPQGGALLALDGVGDYVGSSGEGLAPGGFAEGLRDFINPHQCYLYRWSLGELISALAAADLRIMALNEYCYLNGEQPFAAMRVGAGHRMYPPTGTPAIPLMYGVAAEKTAVSG